MSRVARQTVATALAMAVLVDSREQAPFEVLPGVTMTRATLSEGDYSTEILQGVGVIERKSVADWASSITHGRERFDDEIRRMRDYRWKAIVVEGDVHQTSRVARVHPHSVIGTVASFMARSDIPTFFAGDRVSAARLTFGLLRRWEERLLAERQEAAQ